MNTLAMRLAESRCGRIILHTIAMLRAGHVRWHLSHILRRS